MHVALRLESSLPTALMAALAAACSGSLNPSRPQLLSMDAEANPSQYVVVNIANEPSTLPVEAGSSVRSYPAGDYPVASAAWRAARALEREYGLTEASAWPIPTLRVYCVLLRVPGSQQAAEVIEQLRRDRRVQSVQSLNEFQTQLQVQRSSPRWPLRQLPRRPLPNDATLRKR
jgi:hypothetical protein